MNFKKLKYFRMAAKELNFGFAAEKLYVDRSSISRAVQELESRLGVKLFERQLRQLKLTEEGEMLIQEVNQIFYLFDNINRKIKSSQQLTKSTLELAISPNIDSYRVAELLRVYREKYPHIKINIHENSYQNILSGIKQGQYHVALSLHHPTQDHINDRESNGKLVFQKLWQERLIVLLSKCHPLASLPLISFDDINKFPFISFQSDTLLYQIIYTSTFNPPTTFFVKSYSILQSLVIAGFGISLVTDKMFSSMPSQNIVTRETVTPLLVDTCLIFQDSGERHYEQMTSIKKCMNLILSDE